MTTVLPVTRARVTERTDLPFAQPTVDVELTDAKATNDLRVQFLGHVRVPWVSVSTRYNPDRRASAFPYVVYWLRKVPYEITITLAYDPHVRAWIEVAGHGVYQSVRRADTQATATDKNRAAIVKACIQAAEAAYEALPDGWRLARLAHLEQRQTAIDAELDRLTDEVKALCYDRVRVVEAIETTRQAAVNVYPPDVSVPEPRPVLRAHR